MSEPWRSVQWIVDEKFDGAVSQWFIYDHAAELGASKVGGRLLFKESLVDEFLERNRLDQPSRRPVKGGD